MSSQRCEEPAHLRGAAVGPDRKHWAVPPAHTSYTAAALQGSHIASWRPAEPGQRKGSRGSKAGPRGAGVAAAAGPLAGSMPGDPWTAMRRPGRVRGSASTIRQRPEGAAQDESSACELAESDEEELQEEEVNNSLFSQVLYAHLPIQSGCRASGCSSGARKYTCR